MATWVELPVIVGEDTETRLVNLDAYRFALPYESGSQTQFIEKGGAGSVVVEGVVNGDIIVDVPYATIAEQLRKFVGGKDFMLLDI